MSTGVGMSSCCLSGKIHEGVPTGHEETVAGLKTYVAETADKSRAKSVVILTDVFGWQLKNVRLLADNYAKAGFHVYIPDIHQNDSIAAEFLQDVEPPLTVREGLSITQKATKAASVTSVLGPWLIKHREAVTLPLIDGFINAVKYIPGTNKVGVLGFCWGGRYAVLEANSTGKVHGGVDAAYACHPSMISVPADFEPVNKPLSLAFGDKDSLVDQVTVGKIIDTLAVKTELPHEIRIYEDQVHGFTLRGDWSSDKDKKAMDEALQQGVDWFSTYLS
ncbi:dienelactone hydrolase family protein-like protein [Xylona heveae TC161]|uniref:Dienelactone hydrolase family protein-like protein n=1 Tax=Xylona heveae (strain CBS 132557 / TC161) TaxID=1328760 RepID=A0A165IF03_XYLHT|nr:dienelactone hydrolase family protein-like protein [Xylona heveae TC161]KZF24801.1 dienelactone hydrolase family protein-like protein [Xylona heveae TC161]